jgi:mannose-1-phosphate guanylyltransferase
VRAFLEKPDADQARAAMASGALWNTMILAARVDTLWALGWRCFPEMMPLFERLSSAVGSGEESAVLETIYRLMPVRNFSSGLLQRVAASLVVVELDGVLWSDWGRPERILETLRRIGLADSAGTPSAEASPAG